MLLKSVRLSCGHTLCTDCHEECARQGSTCPLDDEPFDDQSFVRLEISAEYIGKLKVACWNKPSGCSFVGPTASLLEHYKDCAFHTVTCPACQSTLLRRDIVGRVKDGCHVCPNESDHSDSTPHLTHVAKMSNDLKGTLCRLSDGLSSLQTSFNQCREDVREAERRSKEHFEAQSTQFREDVIIAFSTSLPVLEKRLAMELREQSQKLLSATNSACRKVLSFCGAREFHLYFEKWTSLKKKAMHEGTARAESPPEYVCGYNVSIVVALTYGKEHSKFESGLEFHPGSNESKTEWPFRKIFKVTLIHSMDEGKNVLKSLDVSEYPYSLMFQMPTRKPNEAFLCPFVYSPNYLEKNGFVKNDTLHLFAQID
ncbi:uncharacterized protein LOC120840003 [Ixodes scapularis]|uniref:uncharacterized protein LOC120840003 n=1 Tax=Ixodes scapularis TaxID=6945 RepID=UPI001A9D959F|nr:uncharacterized protein LOC120840003 [Ixodes scapularis]